MCAYIYPVLAKLYNQIDVLVIFKAAVKLYNTVMVQATVDVDLSKELLAGPSILQNSFGNHFDREEFALGVLHSVALCIASLVTA